VSKPNELSLFFNIATNVVIQYTCIFKATITTWTLSSP